MTTERQTEIIASLREHWGDTVTDNILNICNQESTVPMTGVKFLDHCVCCGGDWGQMLLSGIKELYPKVYDAIPEDMGRFAFADICYVLNLLNVDTDK